MNRKTLIRIAALLSLVAALILFYQPLMAWFRVAPSAPAAAPEGPSLGLKTKNALKALFEPYEAIRVALALDQLEALAAPADTIGSGLAKLAEDAAETPAHGPLHQGAEAAQGLQTAADLDTARDRFSELSQALFAVVRMAPELGKGWHTFSCPMAKGFPKWFQRPETIDNPYMGQKMLLCGSESDWQEPGEPEAAPEADEIAHYTCPMHPSVKEATMGTCPICKMDLTPVTKSDLETGDVLVDSVRRQELGIRSETVQKHPLKRQVRAMAELAWDEGRIHDVTQRVEGWVEALEVKRVGDTVRRGQVLLRSYSPALAAAQRELLAAPADSGLARAAAQRLHQWGLSKGAVEAIVKRGSPSDQHSLRSPIDGLVIDKNVNQGGHLKPGALLYRIVDPSRVWAMVRLFEQDLPQLREGQTVQVRFPAAPELDREAVIDRIYPSLEGANRAAVARVVLNNPEGQLRPGMYAVIEAETDGGEALAVPANAVIHTGKRRLVFRDLGEGRLRPKEVTTGARIGDHIVVTEGLSEGDSVVASGVFLLAAESRIRSAASYWEPSDANE